MKHLLLTTIAAVLLVGCGESQQLAPAPEAKPVEPVAEASQPEPTTAKAPDISIHKAAEDGNIEAVKQHLAAGTDVNAKDDDGYTPLDYAVPAGKEETADLLRKHGGISGAEDSIHVAAIMGKIEAVKQHLAAGADVNAKHMNGSTPLHWAAWEGHMEVVELLIAKGADVNAKNNKSITPLDAAITRSHTEIADLLRKHGGKTGEELKAAGKPTAPVAEAASPEPPTAKAPDISIHQAAYDGNIEAVKQHLAAGTDVNAKADGGVTPLHGAAAGGQNEIAELLIAEGADVNAKDENGSTPLHLSAWKGHFETAELLITADADVNAKMKDGYTPLDWAERESRRDSSQVKAAKKETANLLRKHGGKTGEELKAEEN
jgi:ankyrin repeat protein